MRVNLRGFSNFEAIKLIICEGWRGDCEAMYS